MVMFSGHASKGLFASSKGRSALAVTKTAAVSASKTLCAID